MSIFGAMFSGVSGLNAQSQSLGVISDNISNINTVGYKGNVARFSTLVTQQATRTAYSSGGVQALPLAMIDKQGLLQASDSSTDIAINGSGFIVVNDDAASAGSFLYTRAGSFRLDASGNLSNTAGLYLQGWPTDQSGVPLTANTSVLTDLETINLTGLSGTATPSSSLTVKANLPATATTGDTHSVTAQIFDSLGAAHNLTLDFAKTATANQWTLSAGDPTLATDSATTTGTTTFGPSTVTFNGDGTLASVSATSLGIAGWTTGAVNSTIALDIGTVGAADGVTQFSNSFTIGSVEQDGQRFGFFTGISFDEEGIVTAQFDNGVTQAIYKVPVATFPNNNGLDALSGNAYREAERSGALILRSAGIGGAGRLAPSSLEASTVDLAAEFTNMITTQRAYSANARIITTADEMLEELNRLGR
ncbi:MAG: flagellar hook protein FlgE [Rhodospirillaceae bacterium]|jgi:flagellar hook protein FlgE|nr:flagellar hook protein FlgE [Rhodospirillaceae bacterium]MBT6118188.1 flagellar hook protein FlgE [Rhodospirillaceae bacterium]